MWTIISNVLLAGLLLQGLVFGLLALSARKRRQRQPNRPLSGWATEPIAVQNNAITVFADGVSLFEAMLSAIRSAQDEILFETYIWHDDEVGHLLRAALIERAEAGVAVWVIYDTLANVFVPGAFFDLPAPIRVLRYRAWRQWWNAFQPRDYGRDHRKILVVDRKVGFVGGYNIGTEYRDVWRDTHIRIDGPESLDLAFAFVDFWDGYVDDDETRPSLPQRPWSPFVRIHRNEPRKLLFPIRAIYIEAIEHAHKQILMTQAYFIPDPAVLAALKRAANRGVDVRILVPWQSDALLADWLSRHLYDECLRSGIRLFLYEDAMIHAKTAVIDGLWTMVGTANMDRLSLAGNYECNVEVFDADLGSHMDRLFTLDLANARELTLLEWRGRSMAARGAEALLSPLWMFV
ncbi:MAG: phospholipase D-like domain-containing protein [Ardenticatenales bacterium]